MSEELDLAEAPRTELFEVGSVSLDSPRLAWIKRHRLTLVPSHVSGGSYVPWVATGKSCYGIGLDEEDACRDWGVRKNVRLWNEEE